VCKPEKLIFPNTWSNESLVQLLRIVGGDDEHPALHLHDPVQHLQQRSERQPVLALKPLHRRHLQQAQQVQPAVLVRVLIRHHTVLRVLVVLISAVLHDVLEVGTVDVLKDVQPLVERDVLAVHLDVVEDVEQLLPALDLVERDGDDVSLGVVGDGLYGGGLAAARLAVQQEAHRVGNAAFFVPGLVLGEEIDSLENVVFLRVEYVGECLPRLKPRYKKK
jgi:hypothetical protein